MPRPKKCRRICCIPSNRDFGPLNGFSDNNEIIVMTIDEFETIRLIDLEGLNQEQCAEHMAVARTTAQAIYNNARRKLAECLINGVKLTISGGDYVLCDGEYCGCRHCHKRKCYSGDNEN